MSIATRSPFGPLGIILSLLLLIDKLTLKASEKHSENVGELMVGAAKLNSEIPQLVAKKWADRPSPVFLAHVGAMLSADAKAELREMGVSLKDFVQLQLRDKIRFLVVGANGDALAPKAETINLTDAELAARHTKTPRLRFPRFMGDVWRAFERPLRSEKRYLTINEGRDAQLHDVSSNDPQPPGSLEVPSEDIPPIDPVTGVAAAAKVFKAIQAWAAKNKLDLQGLLDTSDFKSKEAAMPAASSTTNVSGNVGVERLRNFLEILEPDELAKINIPSEVVLRLLKL
jgi:hypothetical protein